MTRLTSWLVAFGAILAIGLASAPALAQAKPGAVDAPAAHASSVSETRWAGRVTWEHGEVREWTAHFRADCVMIYGYDGGVFDNGRWRQREMLIDFDTNQYFSLHVGHVRGNRMEGVAYNLRGERAVWAFTRQ